MAPLNIKEKVHRPGPSKSLTAILTEPDTASGDTPAFLFLNAGLVHRIGPRRMYVRLSRCLARAGYAALRFDVSGLGDSERRGDGLPYHKSRLLEVKHVMDYLEAKRNIRTFVLVGLCSGADHAFRSATEDDRVVGAALLDGYAYRTPKYYLRRYAWRCFRMSSWLNVVTGGHPLWRSLLKRLPFTSKRSGEEPQSGFVMEHLPKAQAESDLRSLLQRGVELFFVYTDGTRDRFNYRDQFRDMFRSVEKAASVRVEYQPTIDHLFTSVAGQDWLIEAIGSWAREKWSRQ